MRRVLSLFICFAVIPSVAFAQAGGPASGTTAPAGRYQLVVVAGHSGSPFLIDTATGCIWHLIQSQETKRSTFIEVDIENLH